ncbi:hypothetical protein JZO77_13455 [Enterococcus hulanensis]|uniref:hypothetical protein n=1 Tax=Enterococcus hulanensis TaxID=2559929 RepID=UPI001A8FB9DF|nr:hypothetical protein [Enterococcus hulanensis]MBO0457741.1 hypothetical protein [Enterococcus hulanensis]
MDEKQKGQIYSKIKKELKKEDKTNLASFCWLWSKRESGYLGIPENNFPKLTSLQNKIQALYDVIAACFIEDSWNWYEWDLNKVNYSKLARKVKTLTLFLVLSYRNKGTNLSPQDRYQKYFVEELSKISFTNKMIEEDLSFDPIFFIVNKKLLEAKYCENKGKLIEKNLMDFQSINTKLVSADKQRREEKKEKNAKSLKTVMKYLKLNVLNDIDEIDDLFKEFVRILLLCAEVKNAFDTTMALKMIHLRDTLNYAFDENSAYAMKEFEKINNMLNDLNKMLHLETSIDYGEYAALDAIIAEEIRH